MLGFQRCCNFLSAYSDIAKCLVCACVQEQNQRQRYREREREREGGGGASEEGAGSELFHLPPVNHRREGPSQAANQARSWQPALSLLQTIDRLHVKEFST